MQLTVLFLLIGCLSIANAMEEDDVNNILGLLYSFETGGTMNKPNVIDLDVHKLTISGPNLGSTEHSPIVYGAQFDGERVAIKIFKDQAQMDKEMRVYRALNAINNQRIEDNGIPNVYYAGKIFNGFPFIVMTYYDESLATRLQRNQRPGCPDKLFFSRYSTFQVFLQSVKALKYLQSKEVLHNDIDPGNIFLRGNKVFLGGFDCATLNGEHTRGGSNKFGSARFFRVENRTAMDDLESLVYTIWHIAGVHPMNQRSDIPAGVLMLAQSHDQKATFLLEKCKQFEDYGLARRACRVACINEILSGKEVPAYDTIIKHLEEAVNDIEKKTGQTSFEWIRSASSSAPSSSTRV